MTNRLAGETSPYLRQHADNPVDWQPWGPAAFEEAAERDVPVLLSVGYSSCHWCHVMAHESFEDPEVAAIMNEWFVPVKVDREERPDIDSIYMEATQAMTGGGGWPMTVFLTADRRPFFCGTYFPPTSRAQMPGFVDVMEAIHRAWAERRDDLDEQAAQLTAALGRDLPRGQGDLVAPQILDAATEGLLAAFDPRWGGFGNAPKFPHTLSLGHLLRHHQRTGSTVALQAVTTSLDAMASGGMVDLISGGFARYSVDERWLVPHFEKMLYDNALLTSIYTQAHQVTGESRYAQVVTETMDYVLSDLSHPEGGRFSSQDADSLPSPGAEHTREGAFATFTPREVQDILAEAGLSEHAPAACDYWAITDTGNFEGRSIPNRLHARGDLHRPPEIELCRAALADARRRRPAPGLDDKVLTEWNALWVSAAAEAGTALGRPEWIAEAVRTAEFLERELRRADGRRLRSWQHDGGARHLAYGSDYAALAESHIALYRATGSLRWLDLAVGTCETLLELFWDEAGGIFTTGTDAEELLVRPRETVDDATPSASSTAAVVFLELGALTGEPHLDEHAQAILSSLGPLAGRAPMGFGRLLAALHMDATGTTEVVITGDRPDLVAEVHRRFLPATVMAWGEPGSGPLWEGRREGGAEGRAYVCHDHICDAPVTSPAALVAALAPR